MQNSVLTTGEIKEIIDNLYHTIGVRMNFNLNKFPELNNSFPVAQSSFLDVCKAITEHLELPISITPLFSSDFKTTGMVLNQGSYSSEIGAQIHIPSNIPWYKTDSMNNFPITINVPLEALHMGYHFLMTQLSHEFSHVYLHSRRDPQKDSEWATDLCALMMGFTSLWYRGRKHSSRENLSTRTVTRTLTQGYLSDEEFTYAVKYIDTLRSPIVHLRNRISVLRNKIQVACNDISKYIIDNYLLHTFHYKHTQGEFKQAEDAVLFSKMSQPQHKQELEVLLIKSKSDTNAIVRALQHKREFYDKDKKCMEGYVETLNSIEAKLQQTLKELIHDYKTIFRNIDVKHYTRIFNTRTKSINTGINRANDIILSVNKKLKKLNYALELYKQHNENSVTNGKGAEKLSLLCNTDYIAHSTGFIQKEQEKIDKAKGILEKAQYFYSMDDEVLLSQIATIEEAVSTLDYCLKEQKNNIKAVAHNLRFTDRIKLFLSCLFMNS